MTTKFLGREVIDRANCPFCGRLLNMPLEEPPHEMPVGRCACGASYAYDVTGHNVGTAMIDALVYACNGDWERAWDLLPEEDYQSERIENYDIITNKVIPGGTYDGRKISGVLFLIRLRDNLREQFREKPGETPKTYPPLSGRGSKSTGKTRAASKKEVERRVGEYEVDILMEMAAQDKRILRYLHRLIYSPDQTLRWRAAEILGKACAVVAGYDPGAVSKLLQGLITAAADTAASSWGCIDAAGEIIGNSPDRFAGYTRHLYTFVRDREVLPELLRALARIAAARPELLLSSARYFISLLKDQDPEIRGRAVLVLANLKTQEVEESLAGLLDDMAVIEIYSKGMIVTRTIGALASEAVTKQ